MWSESTIENCAMEVFQTESYYIFVKREKSLWWNRQTSEFTLKAGWDLSSVDDIECIGITHGIIGVISLPNVYDPHLVIIKEAVPVGVLYTPHLVYKIKSICILSAEEPDAILTNCTRHNKGSNNSTPTHTAKSTESSATTASSSAHKSRIFGENLLMNKTWGAVKSAGNTIKQTTQQAAAIASNQVKSSVGKRDPTRIEKRITDELHKIFDDTDSFYFCFDNDITNNLQRHSAQSEPDERFFWNRHMLADIQLLNDKTWILPIIQGFVQVEQCVMGNECFTLALVSRRSRHRAGTRYKRRGVDDKGNCANYVETEQILTFRHHQLSFTLVRGSVPIYWSQPGYKYRPPPRLDKGEKETQEAFAKHFTKEIEVYKGVCIINLVEQSGKEKLIGEAYAKHVINFNNESLIYVTFDFHDYCRGMRFENVSTLVESLAVEAGMMGFHWRDQRGVICDQRSVFRVNCMDCLDRTNVVQTALGKAVLESQLVKLGLAPPYTPLPDALKVPFMVLWANNGDIISRQYAGTNALKGDYTRTGERKLTGLMKDGMNSANRYYLARFKDTYRQATIDLMLGNQVPPESLNALGGQAAPDEQDVLESVEHAKLLVEDCRRLLLGSAHYPVGAWGLIDADPISGDLNETEVDTVLLLTDKIYIVAEYDSHLDKIVRFEKVPLVDVTLIELGTYQQGKLFQGASPSFLCLRFNYMLEGVDGYFHMFRSANVRFFNNTATAIKTQSEIMESLMNITEMFRIALDNVGKTDVRILTGVSLPRRKSKIPQLDLPEGMPRNRSESQLLQISSKALSNVAGQFSKLGQSLNPNRSKAVTALPANAAQQQRQALTVDSCMEAEKANFLVGGRKWRQSATSSDSEENDSSIYEPEVESDAEFSAHAACSPADRSAFNRNDFLPSVGIVMCNSNTQEQQQSAQQECNANHLAEKAHLPKHSKDVQALSISSVTDHVTMPTGLLENTQPVRPITPNPQICVQEHAAETAQEAMALQTDLRETSSKSSSPKHRHLKNMGNPLSKIAKGMHNLGLQLDPRKLNIKPGTSVSSNSSSVENSPPERSASNRAQLLELWDVYQCKTKLIAL